MAKTITSVVGIPGPWTSRASLAAALGEKHNLFFSGPKSALLTIPARDTLLTVDVYEPDATLREAFELASGGAFAPGVYDAIGSHTMTVYLVDDTAGSLEAATKMAQCVDAFLDVGGFAAKVESTGVAHERSTWTQLRQAKQLVKMFVVTHLEDDGVSSSGMHNLGCPDVRVYGADLDETRATLDAFLKHVAYDKPTLWGGEGYRRDRESLGYKMAFVKDTRTDVDDLLHNPWGIWELRTRA